MHELGDESGPAFGVSPAMGTSAHPRACPCPPCPSPAAPIALSCFVPRCPAPALYPHPRQKIPAIYPHPPFLYPQFTRTLPRAYPHGTRTRYCTHTRAFLSPQHPPPVTTQPPAQPFAHAYPPPAPPASPLPYPHPLVAHPRGTPRDPRRPLPRAFLSPQRPSPEESEVFGGEHCRPFLHAVRRRCGWGRGRGLVGSDRVACPRACAVAPYVVGAAVDRS